MTQITTMVWSDHQSEPDILECKVKWALGSLTTNKASEGDGIPVELFLILKDDAVKVLYSICQQIWKSQPWPQDWKSQFSFQSQRKAMPKSVQTTAQLPSSHMQAKWCSKFSKPGFNSMWTENFQMCKLDLGKTEEPEIKLPASNWIIKKSKRVPEKHLFLLYWLSQSLGLCGSQQTVENSSKDGNTRLPYLLPEKSVCRSRSNS